jgi:chitinase
MTTEDQYLLVWADCEKFLRSLTAGERKMLTAQMTNSFSWCDLNGKHIPRPNEMEDVFDTVSKMPRYVVDTNANWKTESTKPKNRDKAFIIGETVPNEQEHEVLPNV